MRTLQPFRHCNPGCGCEPGSQSTAATHTEGATAATKRPQPTNVVRTASRFLQPIKVVRTRQPLTPCTPRRQCEPSSHATFATHDYRANPAAIKSLQPTNEVRTAITHLQPNKTVRRSHYPLVTRGVYANPAAIWFLQPRENVRPAKKPLQPK